LTPSDWHYSRAHSVSQPGLEIALLLLPEELQIALLVELVAWSPWKLEQ